MKISTYNKRMKIRKIKEYIIYNMKKEFHVSKKDINIDILRDSYKKIIVGICINKIRRAEKSALYEVILCYRV